MSDPAGAICGAPVQSNLFIVEHPVPTPAILRFIRSAPMALIVIREPFRPSQADLRRIVRQHSCTVQTAQSIGVNYKFFFVVALRPQKQDGLLGTGTGWEGYERVKARPRIPPEKDRRDRGPPPEQWKC